jgi:hypothetical protein
MTREGNCVADVWAANLLFASSHGGEGTKHIGVFGMRRFPVKLQVSSPSNEQERHILEVWVLEGLFCCDSALRVVSQKPHHEVDTSISLINGNFWRNCGG